MKVKTAAATVRRKTRSAFTEEDMATQFGEQFKSLVCGQATAAHLVKLALGKQELEVVIQPDRSSFSLFFSSRRQGGLAGSRRKNDAKGDFLQGVGALPDAPDEMALVRKAFEVGDGDKRMLAAASVQLKNATATLEAAIAFNFVVAMHFRSMILASGLAAAWSSLTPYFSELKHEIVIVKGAEPLGHMHCYSPFRRSAKVK